MTEANFRAAILLSRMAELRAVGMKRGFRPLYWRLSRRVMDQLHAGDTSRPEFTLDGGVIVQIYGIGIDVVAMGSGLVVRGVLFDFTLKLDEVVR